MILGRNELAKWHKLNSTHIDLPRHVFQQDNTRRTPHDQNAAGSAGSVELNETEENSKWDQIKVVRLPAMISRVSECKMCFSKEVCTLAAISIEADIPRKAPVGNFPAF